MAQFESLECRRLMAAYRNFYIGNSMTDGLSYAGLSDLIKSDGSTVTWGRQTKAGGTQAGNYFLDQYLATSGFDPARPTNSNPWGNYTQAFSRQWDVLTLQPNERRFTDDLETVNDVVRQEGEVPSTIRFMKLLAQKSPNAQVFIYSRPARRNDLTEFGEPTGIPNNYSARWNGTYYDSGPQINFEFYTRSAVTQIMPLMRNAQQADPVTRKMPAIKLIPAGEAYYNIDQMIRAGKFAGTAVKSIIDLYQDHTHPTQNLGAYVLALTFESSLTGRDPRGQPVPGAYSPKTGPLSNPTVVKLVQQAVYDAINLPAYRAWTNIPTTATASITGSVFRDKNADGKWSTGEPALAGRVLWIDLNNNGVKESTEPTQTTNTSGKYTFASLKAGTYKVREVVPSGWAQTFPLLKAGINVTLAAGQKKTGVDFLVKINPAKSQPVAAKAVFSNTRVIDLLEAPAAA